jgi:hypothetical protein
VIAAHVLSERIGRIAAQLMAMDESFFPVLWDETGGRTAWLQDLPELT